MRFPSIIINYKAYETSYGKRALELAKIAERISEESGVEIVLSVPYTIIHRVSSHVSLPVFSQSVDPDPPGAHTGKVIPEMILEAGARGALLNHSENRMRVDLLADAVDRLRQLGLDTVVCVDRYELVRPVGLLNPTAVLIEPPELIGSGKAVSKERPEVISRAVEMLRGIEGVALIAGAGITSGVDVKRSLELGASGVGLASAFMKAQNPELILRDLVGGIRSVP